MLGGRINITIVLDELVSILNDFKTFFYAFSLRFLPPKECFTQSE